jgi:hypothetical protein
LTSFIIIEIGEKVNLLSSRIDDKFDLLSSQIDDKFDLLSTRIDTILENFKPNNNTNSNITNLISEDIKKLLKDSMRRNLFIYEKYPNDLKIEKFCKELLVKTFPENQNYKDKLLWDNVWFQLRTFVSDLLLIYINCE